MTREEAIKELQSYAEASWGGLNEAFNLALTALRGPTREMAERMQGEWIEYEHPHIICCTQCDYGTGPSEKTRFCPSCGAPMTDEAVDMMLERWKEALPHVGD